MSKEIHKGHRQRLKNRYITSGLESFDDHQVLELLLFYCYPMVDTNEKAHKMILEFGSLSNLLEAQPLEIMNRCKVTENVAVLVSLIPPLSKRYGLGKWRKKDMLNTSTKVGKYVTSLFKGKIYECFYLICLDTNRGLIYTPLVSEGTIDEAPLYTRLIIELCLRHQAASVILTHNHPSGSLEPSGSDLAATQLIIAALKTINIDVLDHFIVAGENYISMAEKKIFKFNH